MKNKSFNYINAAAIASLTSSQSGLTAISEDDFALTTEPLMSFDDQSDLDHLAIGAGYALLVWALLLLPAALVFN